MDHTQTCNEAIRLHVPGLDTRDDGPETVRKIVELYLIHLRERVEARAFSAEGIKDVTRDLRGFAATFGHQTIAECRRFDLTRWLSLNPQWKSVSTRKRVVAELLACFNWAEDAEFIDRCPYRRPRSLRGASKRRREASATEYVALMKCPSRPLRRALFFLRRVGVRPAEMRELRYDEIDFEAGVVVKEKHKTRGKTGEPRMFGLDPAVIRFIRNIQRRRDPAKDLGYVFTNAYGCPWADRHVFARHLRRWARNMGLDAKAADRVSAYCFRHSWITSAVEAGMPDRQIADQAGHQDTRMIAWYSKAAQKKRHLQNVAAEAIRLRKR